MCKSENKEYSVERTEYTECLNMFRHFGNSRRRDMAFITTAQGVVLTVVGQNLLNLNLSLFILTVIAVFLLITGFNNERRLSAYMRGYIKRAKYLENKIGMNFLAEGFKEIQNTNYIVSNMHTFSAYYVFFTFAWISIWILNFFK